MALACLAGALQARVLQYAAPNQHARQGLVRLIQSDESALRPGEQNLCVDAPQPCLFGRLMLEYVCYKQIRTALARGRKSHVAKRRTASSFQSIPEPGSSSTSAIPFSTRNGFARIGFHQSAYSNQCAIGVQQSKRALISGHRWLDTRKPFACASDSVLSQPLTPPIFITSRSED
jgi:hypothetical protein